MDHPPPHRYPALDTMRAVASVAVVATHTTFWSGEYTRGLWGAAAGRLDVGVAIFFVLSGFLLSLPYLRSMAGGPPAVGTSTYLWRRGLRVLPVYWVCVVAAFLLLPENRATPRGTWTTNLTLVDLYGAGPLPHGLTQMWSLSTEVAFYVLLPVAMLATARWLLRGRWRPGVVVATLAVGAAVSIAWLGGVGPWLTGERASAGQWLPAYLTWFGAGIALATVVTHVQRHPDRPWRVAETAARLGRSPGSCWVAAAAVLAVACTPVAGPVLIAPATPAESITKNLLYTVIAALLVLPAVFAEPSSRFARAMSHAGPRHLGAISYSLFCCHLVVLELVMRWQGRELFQTGGLSLFLTVLVLSLAVSEVLYRVVESPFLRLKDRRRGRPAAETTSPSPTTAST